MLRITRPIIACLLGAALAATEPASRPAVEPVDSGAPATRPADASPVDAMLRYNAAMRAGDTQGIIDSYHTTTPEEARYVRLIADAETHIGRLLTESARRFGEPAAKKVGKAIGDLGDDDARRAKVTTDGDTAQLVFDDPDFPLNLIRIDGVWKYDFRKWLGAESGLPTQIWVEGAMRTGHLAKVLAQDVAIGKFKTVDELIAEIERELKRQRGE